MISISISFRDSWPSTQARDAVLVMTQTLSHNTDLFLKHKHPLFGDVILRGVRRPIHSLESTRQSHNHCIYDARISFQHQQLVTRWGNHLTAAVFCRSPVRTTISFTLPQFSITEHDTASNSITVSNRSFTSSPWVTTRWVREFPARDPFSNETRSLSWNNQFSVKWTRATCAGWGWGAPWPTNNPGVSKI